MTTNNGQWRKSSYSGGQSNDCVELRLEAERTSIRDSKCPEAGRVVVERGTWLTFLAAMHAVAAD